MIREQSLSNVCSFIRTHGNEDFVVASFHWGKRFHDFVYLAKIKHVDWT